MGLIRFRVAKRSGCGMEWIEDREGCTVSDGPSPSSQLFAAVDIPVCLGFLDRSRIDSFG